MALPCAGQPAIRKAMLVQILVSDTLVSIHREMHGLYFRLNEVRIWLLLGELPVPSDLRDLVFKLIYCWWKMSF